MQPERNAWLEEFENDEGWEDVVRVPSPRNPFQKKTRVQIKRRPQGDVVYLLCRSDGREAKDRAIRDKHEGHWLRDVQKLQRRVATGRLKAEPKIQQAIGRLRERRDIRYRLTGVYGPGIVPSVVNLIRYRPVRAVMNNVRAIVDAEALRDAAAKIDGATGTISGTIASDQAAGTRQSA